jgi:hypothetical protein
MIYEYGIEDGAILFLVPRYNYDVETREWCLEQEKRIVESQSVQEKYEETKNKLLKIKAEFEA